MKKTDKVLMYSSISY